MKKKLLTIAVVLVVILVVAVVIVGLSLDSIVKRGVETVGPQVAKVSIKLDGVKLSLLSGRGELSGLVVGNPEGYKTESAIKMKSIAVAVQPGSLLSDKLIVRSVNIQAPEITWEGGLSGNNLQKILDNVQASDETRKKEPSSESGKAGSKKLQVDELVINGGKIHVVLTDLPGQSGSVTLPEIHLKDIGTGADGVTTAELTEKILNAILEKAGPAVSGSVTDLRKAATEQLKGASDRLQKDPVGAVTNLFRRRQ